MMEDVIAHGRLIYSGPRTRLAGSESDPPFAYAFYSPTSGEVWAHRIPRLTDGVKPSWVYVPKESPWLLLGYEEVQCDFPLEFTRFILENAKHDHEVPHPGI